MANGQISKWQLVRLWLIERKTVEEIREETGVCKDSQKQARELWDIPDKDDHKRRARIDELTHEYMCRIVSEIQSPSLKVVARP